MTRRSTIGFTAAYVLSYICLGALTGTSTPNPGLIGLVIAVIAAVLLVSLVVAWVAGIILAWRSRSLIWLLVACLPPPLGALPCALFAPAPRGPGSVTPPRTRGPLR